MAGMAGKSEYTLSLGTTGSQSFKSDLSSAAQSISFLGDDLKGLNQAQMKIRSFRRVGKELRITGKAMSKAQAETKRLARELKFTQKPTQKLRAEFNRSKARTSQLNKKFQDQRRQLQDLRGELSDAGISVQELGRHEKRLAARAEEARRAQVRLGKPPNAPKPVSEWLALDVALWAGGLLSFVIRPKIRGPQGGGHPAAFRLPGHPG